MFTVHRVGVIWRRSANVGGVQREIRAALAPARYINRIGRLILIQSAPKRLLRENFHQKI